MSIGRFFAVPLEHGMAQVKLLSMLSNTSLGYPLAFATTSSGEITSAMQQIGNLLFCRVVVW